MTPEAQKILDELQKEYDDITEKGKTPYVITQSDFDNSNHRFRENHKVGDTVMSNPPLSNDPKQAYETFVNFYAKLKCIVYLQIYIQKYEGWNIAELERELGELREFRTSAQEYRNGKDDESAPIGIRNFNKLVEGYYHSHAIVDYEKETLSDLFGRYVLYFDLLHEKVVDLYEAGKFSKLNQIEQLDKILGILCSVGELRSGLTAWDIRQDLRRDNYVISMQVLEEIMHKLEKDEFVRTRKGTAYIVGNRHDDITYYTVTFEGRFFYNQEGGYKEKIAKENAESTRLENLENHQKNHRRWMTWLTVILSVFAFLSVFLQSFEKFDRVFRIHIWSAFFVYVSGILTAACIWLIILEVSKRINKQDS